VVQPILVVDLPQQLFDPAGTVRIGEQLARRAAAELQPGPVEPFGCFLRIAEHAGGQLDEIVRIMSMHRVLC
jgi:hypothetical protein